MIIKKITLSGFNHLFNGMKFIKDNNYINGLKSNLMDFLDHCMITIDLDDISGIELFYLRKFASNVYEIDYTYSNFIKVNNQEDEKVSNAIESLLKTYNNIIEDQDMDYNKQNLDSFLPLGCKKSHVISYFRGGNILFITGMDTDIQDMFKNFSYPVDLPKLEEIIFNKFINAFYSTIINDIKDINDIYEFIKFQEFYKYSDTKCTLSDVQSQFGEISFLGSNQSKLKNEISSITENIKKFPYIIYHTSFMNFILNTSFEAFLNIYMNDKSAIVDYEKFITLLQNQKIDIDEKIIAKYSTRISDPVRRVKSYIKNNIKQINIQSLNFIFLGKLIKYSYKVSFEDIINDNFLNNKKNNIYSLKRNEYEINSIKNNIKNQSKSILNIIK